MDNFIEEQRVVTVQANQETETVESSLVKELDGFQSRIDQKLDILQESFSKLTNQFVHQEEENLEEECLTETILVEQDKLQPQEELKVESAEAPEELQEALESSVAICLWEEKEATFPLTEKSSGHETVEGTQEPIIQPNPIDLDPAPQSQPKTPTANAQATYNPLPVYILPAANSKPTTPTPKGKSNPSLHAMQNLKILVAYVHNFATTSKAQAAAYTAWHSGWFGCGFEFGAPGPRHF